jgi:hypothetical protein
MLIKLIYLVRIKLNLRMSELSFLLNKFKMDTTVDRLSWQKHNFRIEVSFFLDLIIPIIPTCPPRMILCSQSSRSPMCSFPHLILRWTPVDNRIRWFGGNGSLQRDKAKVKITKPFFFPASDLRVVITVFFYLITPSLLTGSRLRPSEWCFVSCLC